MLVLEAKLKGKTEQYSLIDEAIRTALFVRNKALRYWMDNHGANKYDLSAQCAVLAKEFDIAKKLNSQARQSSAERAWSAINRYWVEYFGKVFGKVTVAVPPHYTSQNCSSCGTMVKKSLSERTHQCSHCGTVLDRDHNAALNVLAIGLNRVGHTQISTPVESSTSAN
jgi:transposase